MKCEKRAFKDVESEGEIRYDTLFPQHNSEHGRLGRPMALLESFVGMWKSHRNDYPAGTSRQYSR